MRVFIKLHLVITSLISLDTSITGREEKWASLGSLWEWLYQTEQTFVSNPFQHKVNTLFGLLIPILRPPLAINLNAIQRAGHVAVPPSRLQPCGSVWAVGLNALLELLCTSPDAAPDGHVHICVQELPRGHQGVKITQYIYHSPLSCDPVKFYKANRIKRGHTRSRDIQRSPEVAGSDFNNVRGGIFSQCTNTEYKSDSPTNSD